MPAWMGQGIRARHPLNFSPPVLLISQCRLSANSHQTITVEPVKNGPGASTRSVSLSLNELLCLCWSRDWAIRKPDGWDNVSSSIEVVLCSESFFLRAETFDAEVHLEPPLNLSTSLDARSVRCAPGSIPNHPILAYSQYLVGRQYKTDMYGHSPRCSASRPSTCCSICSGLAITRLLLSLHLLDCHQAHRLLALSERRPAPPRRLLCDTGCENVLGGLLHHLITTKTIYKPEATGTGALTRRIFVP